MTPAQREDTVGRVLLEIIFPRPSKSVNGVGVDLGWDELGIEAKNEYRRKARLILAALSREDEGLRERVAELERDLNEARSRLADSQDEAQRYAERWARVECRPLIERLEAENAALRSDLNETRSLLLKVTAPASPVASREAGERRGFPSRTEWLEWCARQPSQPTPEEAFIGGWHLRSKDRDSLMSTDQNEALRKRVRMPDRLTDAQREAMKEAWDDECMLGLTPGPAVAFENGYTKGFLAALSREDEGRVVQIIEGPNGGKGVRVLAASPVTSEDESWRKQAVEYRIALERIVSGGEDHRARRGEAIAIARTALFGDVPEVRCEHGCEGQCPACGPLEKASEDG